MGREAVERFASEILARTGYHATFLGVQTLREHDLTVHVFRLREHPLGSFAYAWGGRGCVVVVRPPPIDAEAAVLDAMRD
jgi:hypothetical protein